jgi:integrase
MNAETTTETVTPTSVETTIDVWSDTVPGPRQRHVYRRSPLPPKGLRFEHVSNEHEYTSIAPIERPTSWPATRTPADQVVGYLDWVLPVVSPSQRDFRRRNVPRLLAWLLTFTGDTWQQRWVASKLADLGPQWCDDAPLASPNRVVDRRSAMTGAMTWLMAGDLIRPSYRFIYQFRSHSMFNAARRLRDPAGFERMHQLCDATPRITLVDRNHALNQLARMLIHNGGTLAELTLADCVEAYRAQVGFGARQHAHWYVLLRDAGILPVESPPTMWAASRTGQATPEILIDRYSLKCLPVRDLLVDYLHERTAAVDYSTLNQLAIKLGLHFWSDLERHHPGIDSLHLDDDTVRAWKLRLKTVSYGAKAGRRREDPNTIYLAVRGFYSDIATWALTDPQRWGPWVAPSPIGPHDLMGQNKAHHQATARTQQRTRELAPHQPRLVAWITEARHQARLLLDRASVLQPGAAFEHEGQQFIVDDHGTKESIQNRRPGIVYVRDTMGKRRNITLEHHQAFMCWAIVEVFRHTGVRREELLELTHRSLVAYTLPDTGETIPLLHITPSKTDRERLIVVSPELADALAELINHVAGPDGRVPLIVRYDGSEHLYSEPLPFLFQLPFGLTHQVVTPGRIAQLLNNACHNAGLAGNDGQPLKFTPHDFRRVFATEAVAAGLPVHITAKLLGHLSLNTTQGYVAVYDRDVIEHHQAFIARRRAQRPSGEYREPTDAEWDDFLGHFTKRRVALGTCARPYGTPCVHEHACIRCPLLRLDHAQRDRLVEIVTNLETRLVEAETEHWHGEIDAITTSLIAARAKLDTIPALAPRPARRRTLPA